MRKKRSHMNRIPLGKRLGTLTEMGVSDLSVLPIILRTWGDTPASAFFQKQDHLECMLRALNRAEIAGLTYWQMAREIYRLSRLLR